MGSPGLFAKSMLDTKYVNCSIQQKGLCKACVSSLLISWVMFRRFSIAPVAKLFCIQLPLFKLIAGETEEEGVSSNSN